MKNPNRPRFSKLKSFSRKIERNSRPGENLSHQTTVRVAGNYHCNFSKLRIIEWGVAFQPANQSFNLSKCAATFKNLQPRSIDGVMNWAGFLKQLISECSNGIWLRRKIILKRSERADGFKIFDCILHIMGR